MEYELNHLQQPVGMPVTNWQPPEFMQPQVLAGKLCRLEPLQVKQHAEALHHAFSLDSDGRNWTYLPYGPFVDIASFNAWLESTSVGADPLFYAIVDIATGMAVGLASYLRIDPKNGCIEVGHLNFSPLMQRTPLATEAMYLMMAHAFAMGYRRYEWKCNALNAPSRIAAQRLGFSFEGIFRQALVVKGRNRDTAWYSILDSEWPQLKAAFECWLAPQNFDADGKQRLSLSAMTSPLVKQKG
jgi:RimJ/RimL family protein N-acetyltransferase